MRTWVYIDGFNLYYRAIRKRVRSGGPKLHWLNLDHMCRLLLPRHEIEKIRYFTAIVSGLPTDPDKPTRQIIYHRALLTIPNLSIHLGHFLTNRTKMPLAYCPPDAREWVSVTKVEEKGSDVNLATRLIHDAHCDRFESAVVVSGDSDLVQPIRIVVEEIGKPVGVLNPSGTTSKQLHAVASFYKTIRGGVLKKSQFPNVLRDDKGEFHKPPDWN